MMLSNVVAQMNDLSAGKADSLRVEGDIEDGLAQQHLLYSQHILSEMAQVRIVLDEAGLSLVAPNRNTWEPDEMASDFAQMPEAFARSYLQLRLRNFLYETFCESHDLDDLTVSSESDVSHSNSSISETPNLVNDRVGGGIHVGLLENFNLSNQGKGYSDPGWQVVREESDGAIAVQKHGIIVHVEPRHLSAEKQAQKQAIQPEEWLAIRLPGYRFEPDFYVAIGDQGPVADINQAQEIYFAATTAAMPLIMKTLTTELNKGEQAIPYTLQVPYEPEGYQGPEAIVLRIEKTDFEQVLPLLQQIWEMCSQEEASQLRPEVPVFAYPLWSGISMADVIESSATEWFGSSAELSRIDWVAEALTQVWYEHSAEASQVKISSQISPLTNMLAIKAQFSQVQLSCEQPFSRTLTI